MKKVAIILGLFVGTTLLVFLGIGMFAPDYVETVSVEIDAPLAKTWAIFNDPANMEKWMSTDQMKFESIELISGKENEVGSKYKLVMTDRGNRVEMIETVMAYEFQKRFAFNLKDDFADFNLDISFKEDNGKTIVTEVNSGGIELPFFSKVMVYMFRGMIKAQKEEMYGQLKELVEKS